MEGGGACEERADGLLKLLSRIENDGGVGGGNSNQLYIVSWGEPNLSNHCLGQHGVEMVPKNEEAHVLRDR